MPREDLGFRLSFSISPHHGSAIPRCQSCVTLRAAPRTGWWRQLFGRTENENLWISVPDGGGPRRYGEPLVERQLRRQQRRRHRRHSRHRRHPHGWHHRHRRHPHGWHHRHGGHPHGRHHRHRRHGWQQRHRRHGRQQRHRRHGRQQRDRRSRRPRDRRRGAGGASNTDGGVQQYAAFSYTFDKNTQGFALNTFNGNGGNLLAVEGGSPPTLTWDSSVGSPSTTPTGSLKVDATFTGYSQFVQAAVNITPTIDATGKSVHAFILLDKEDGGATWPGSVQLSASTGSTYNGFAPITASLTPGTWKEVVLPLTGQAAPFDPSQLIQIGVRVRHWAASRMAERSPARSTRPSTSTPSPTARAFRRRHRSTTPSTARCRGGSSEPASPRPTAGPPRP